MKLDLKKVLIIKAQKGMTDIKFLKESELPSSTWYYVKQGGSNARQKTIKRIAKGLGVQISEIVELNDVMEHEQISYQRREIRSL